MWIFSYHFNLRLRDGRESQLANEESQEKCTSLLDAFVMSNKRRCFLFDVSRKTLVLCEVAGLKHIHLSGKHFWEKGSLSSTGATVSAFGFSPSCVNVGRNWRCTVRIPDTDLLSLITTTTKTSVQLPHYIGVVQGTLLMSPWVMSVDFQKTGYNCFFRMSISLSLVYFFVRNVISLYLILFLIC